MPRIIAGTVGSIPLKSAAGRHTRPTADRVKEALFARLDAIDMIEGSAVLDLCAGSGALALESISRGAASADLVEKNAASYRFLQENIATVSKAVRETVEGQERRPLIRGYLSEALRFLQSVEQGKRWDVVFLDPPYSMGNREVTVYAGLLGAHLAVDGLIIVERSARDRAFLIPPALQLYDVKKYGDVVLYLLEFAEWEHAGGGENCDFIREDGSCSKSRR